MSYQLNYNIDVFELRWCDFLLFASERSLDDRNTLSRMKTHFFIKRSCSGIFETDKTWSLNEKLLSYDDVASQTKTSHPRLSSDYLMSIKKPDQSVTIPLIEEAMHELFLWLKSYDDDVMSAAPEVKIDLKFKKLYKK